MHYTSQVVIQEGRHKWFVAIKLTVDSSQKVAASKQISHAVPYLKEGEPFVPVNDHFKALVVDEGEEAGVPELVCGYRQFLQGHSDCAFTCSCGGIQDMRCLAAGNVTSEDFQNDSQSKTSKTGLHLLPIDA